MKRGFSLVEISVEHPGWVVVLTAAVTMAFLTQFPKAQIDTNPKNMLPASSAVRVWNDEVDRTFGLYEDMIVLGVTNAGGVFNPGTLQNIHILTDSILKLPGVAARDVSSLTTIDDITVDAGTLAAQPILSEIPAPGREMDRFKKRLLDNPLLVDRIIAKDGKTAAIYIPLEKGANGKEVADRIREILGTLNGRDRYYLAGDPVARDTFGSEMFKLMAIFAPLAGAVMFAARFLMFRDLLLSFALMMDAMVAIVWSMGLMIALGLPIHIMSSMAPVFLMAIATDSIHIFNEFYFRQRQTPDRKTAILETMAAVSRPVRYTALATAAGFAVLLCMSIVPVKIFGGVVAFGAVILRVLSFSFIPAMFMFAKDDKAAPSAQTEDEETGASRFLRNLAGAAAGRPAAVLLAGLAMLGFSVWGMTKIVVNNNMVEWFKSDSDILAADRALNKSLGGTSTGYIVAEAGGEGGITSPEAMNAIEGLQTRLANLPVVGKTISVVDYVKRINRILHDDDPAFETVPESRETIGQHLLLMGMSARPSDLNNVVDYAHRKANIQVQLKTWDAEAMRTVIGATEDYRTSTAPSLSFKPAGIAYFNLVWNDEVLWDMVKGFILSLVVVFVILVFYFRSFKWAVVGYMPLLFTVCLIYGVVGFIGKDFDMPISVLSCLSLGMAVDFSIHFIGRFRERLGPSPARPAAAALTDALLWTAGRPGKGILRNAVLFAAAFSVMLFAPLTPYVTVGAFIVGMMTLSALMTLIYLPALIVKLRPWLFAAGVRHARPRQDHSGAGSGAHPDQSQSGLDSRFRGNDG